MDRRQDRGTDGLRSRDKVVGKAKAGEDRADVDEGSRRQHVLLNDGRGSFVSFSPPLVVDGIYGPKTAAAVKAAQQEGGIPVDGIVGLQTWGLTTGDKPNLRSRRRDGSAHNCGRGRGAAEPAGCLNALRARR